MNLKPIALALAALISASAALADTSGYSGSLTASSPTFDRPYASFSGLSPYGSGVYYSASTFTVTASGSYDFLTTSNGYDTFLLLYQTSFDPNNSLANGLIGNDDLNNSTAQSGFAYNLTAGMAYVLVNTSFSAGEVGNFNQTVTGPGVIAAVPEPGTYALLALGLGLVAVARRRSLK